MAANQFFVSRDLDDGRAYRAANVDTQVEATYPSAYWETNPGLPIVHTRLGDANVQYHRLAAMLTGAWDDVTVTSFMVSVIQEQAGLFTQTTRDAWIADGQTICDAVANPDHEPTTLSPLSLLRVVPGENPVNPAPVVESTQETRLAYFAGLIMLGRKSHVKQVNEAYSGVVSDRMNALFKTNPIRVTDQTLNATQTLISEDNITKGYRRLLCAIDMFFFKFTTHPSAYIRMATLYTRYRGCVALTAAAQVAKSAGMPPMDLHRYIFTLPIAKECKGLLRTGEGADDVFGYFPYQLDMQLTPKSPYSLAVNPTYLLWIHSIGAMLGLQRSINARMPQNACDIAGTVLTGVAVGLGLGAGFGLQRQVATTRAHADAIRAQEARAEEAANQQEADRIKMEIRLDLIEAGTIPAEPETEAEEQNILAQVEEIYNNEGRNRGEGELVARGDPRDLHVVSILKKLKANQGLSNDQRNILRDKAYNMREANENSIGKYLYTTYAGQRR